ncbi:tripartite tricarboxylate transporter substrate binding protein (plasmid) [Variovorax sp. V59]|jgi:tripartite-type tricarboxylate transporter receptor subunit TctC|uniref:Tripartite-type tricarboxylate transporter receptor subunit TctC n=1 Tax=Variovorax paradoxus TaxID=34073 RepID=A0AAE3Y140_VARPD|nr:MULTISPECIES: tripartite tricarboxylate transporter substrate binding protein [Variovorax]MBD9668882.1 tripartite tricarboxylate transporter substrate binding protein [Variovorax sp. VRV01]MDP9965390.1 tripartite-type tricarboxylate transporter receptor subunit TctC [Variovorax paradoxus]MDR6428649.1 tripartite-type tricarboxylate transporter receptor subunit TctC [Variovorax paradoxus]MDR6456024.1 tripartite-type tricarboxylate transporter receptor subunit TctC [Variovorax paradoxus]
MKKLLIALACSVSMAAFAQATNWPEKPVTIVVPFPAGGSTDMVARAMALQMQTKLGQTFLVDNKPGATGTIGAGFVKRAAPDGYTLLVSSLGAFVVTPHLQKSVPYDATKDFDYISVPVQAPNVLVASPGQKARTVAEVIAELKANPGKVSFASSGNGSSDHLSAEVFWQQTQTEGLHIPYKGGAPAINDLLGNQVNFSFQNVNAVLQHIKAGKLHAIAVTGDKRSPVLPNVPTLAEAGVKGAEVYSWQGLAAPKGLPPAVKEKLAAAAIAAINDPEVKKRMVEQGLEIVASTPAEFTAFQAREWTRWKTLIETRKITAD